MVLGLGVTKMVTCAIDFAGGPKFDGNRWNEPHYTRAFKRAFKEAARVRQSPKVGEQGVSSTQAETLIDALKLSFTAAMRAPDGVSAPVALLWTDADAQWKPLLPALQKILPHLYLLGPYAPEERQGPSHLAEMHCRPNLA